MLNVLEKIYKVWFSFSLKAFLLESRRWQHAHEETDHCWQPHKLTLHPRADRRAPFKKHLFLPVSLSHRRCHWHTHTHIRVFQHTCLHGYIRFTRLQQNEILDISARMPACGVVSWPKLRTGISKFTPVHAYLSVPAETCKRPHTGYLTGDQFGCGLMPCVFNWPHISLYTLDPAERLEKTLCKPASARLLRRALMKVPQQS